MKTLLLCTVLGLALANCPAEDLKTLDGESYKDIGDVKAMPDGLIFSYNAGSSRIKVPFNRLPDDIKQKYNYDPFEEGLFLARQNNKVDLKKDMAFWLDDLEAAKQKAKAEKKMIGFVVVWDNFFGKPAKTMGQGSPDALAQYYTTFHNALVLVFVSHERDAERVPPAGKRGLSGLKAGKFSPKMAVVTGDCSQYVCIVPYGEGTSTGYEREVIFKQKIAVIKKFASSPPKSQVTES